MNKIKSTFLPMLALVLMMTITSTGGAIKAPTNYSVYEGRVNGDDLAGKWMEYYVNHTEQMQPIPLQRNENGEFYYHVAIPIASFPAGSTVMFKIDDQVYGFVTLQIGRHIVDLSMDEQSH